MQTAASQRTATGADLSRSRWPLIMLVSRFCLFLAWQAAIAGYYALQGDPSPWQASVAWWPVTVTLTNVICYGLLRYLARREGLTFWQLIGADFGREHLRKDLLFMLGLLVLAGPVAMGPEMGLGNLLYGDYLIPVSMFTQALPVAVALVAAVFTFPLTQAMAELPTYFAFTMPRLARRWKSPWAAILVASLWLSLQHMTAPFIPDWRFALWRGVMFFPFAFMLGWAVNRNRRLMPYLMVVHALIDLPVGLMVYQASVG